MNEFVALLQLIQAAAQLAPAIQVVAGKDPSKVEALSRILSSVLNALGRGAEGSAYLQTIGAELQALHDQGKTITQVDLTSVLQDIQDVAAEIEAERAKLDAPPITALEGNGEAIVPPAEPMLAEGAPDAPETPPSP